MSSRDNWERLVAAVLKREQLWQLFHQDSISTISSDDFSGQILGFSSNSLEGISVPPPPHIPLTNPSASQASKNATTPFVQKLFAAWYGRRKAKDTDFDDVPVEEDLGINSVQVRRFSQHELKNLGTNLAQVRRFSLHELKVATDNFSNKNALNHIHGYNKVYKGRLADGSTVAVKRFKDGGFSQPVEIEFLREVEINNIALHPNVLHMLGVSIKSIERLIVYPLLANGRVDSWLRDRHESQPLLNWSVRKGIAQGAARGLAYLHDKCDPQVIHRDIKAANILLDEEFKAVVADFELALIMDYDGTHASTGVIGTFGHIAPDYLSTGECSEKADVFGYGIFLLELITGQRAFDLARQDMMLLDWVRRNYKGRKCEMIVDADCGSNYMEDVVEQLVQIALLCTQTNPQKRPKMSEVVRMLEVGDGLGERLEECYKKQDEQETYTSYTMRDDDTLNILPDEVSGPR